MSEQDPLHPSGRRRQWRRTDDRKLLQRERELNAARRVSQALFLRKGVDELAETVLQTSLDVIGAEAGSILLADPEAKTLVFRYVLGPRAAVLHGTHMPWDKGISGAVFQSGEPAVISDAGQDDRHYSAIDDITGMTTRDMIVLPLKRWGDEPIGVMIVLNKREGQLDQDDVAILTIVSALSAQAIEEARLFEEAKLAEVAGLLGDIGHDVQNMLFPITMGGPMLRDAIEEFLQGGTEREQAGRAANFRARCLKIIEMQGKGAVRIQDRMKELADCVKGLSAPPNFAWCCVADVVQNVLEALHMAAEEKGIRITLENLDTLPSIQADERRLYNAFYNLINNAIPEVLAGGSITVRGRADPAAKAIRLEVADTGRGMPPHVREKLFTKRAVSTKAGGTGLGTKIVKDVVDAHAGTITVDSEEGKGTTFYIHLPLTQPGCTAK